MLKFKTYTKEHIIYNLCGIKFKFKFSPSFKFNNKEIKHILSQISNNKINYLYLDWDFGKYVFEEMLKEKYSNINLIEFSLFKVLNIKNRIDFWNLWEEDKILFKKNIEKTFKKKRISGFLVTQDWAPAFSDLIDIFKEINIPTICIIHEGVFQNENIYYNSTKPVSAKVLTWGEQTKNIFIKRGYPSKDIHCVGSIKLNSYKTFKPTISKEKFFQKLKLDSNKKTIMYCCQLCDFQWGNQQFALNKQMDVINDLIYIAKEDNYNLIIRNAPANPKLILPNEFIEKYINDNICFDGNDIDNSLKSTYLINSKDSIYYANLIIGMNTTMQLEASVLNKPSIVVKYFDFDDKWHRELGLPVCKDKFELKNCIRKFIKCKKSLIADDSIKEFYNNYGYYPDKTYNPIKNIEKILLTIPKEYKK